MANPSRSESSVPPTGGGQVLLDPSDTVILLLDHRAGPFQTVRDIGVADLRRNVETIAKLAALPKSPAITTASKPNGPNGPLLPEIDQSAPHPVYVPREGEVNAWNNEDLVEKLCSRLEEDFGRELALAVARYMVVFLKRPGGQSQFSAYLAAQVTARSSIRQIQEHVLTNLTGDLSVDALANRAGMSTRNFSRVFRREAGMTPADFVEAARVDAARRLLEDAPTSLKRVAYVCGFGNADGMRRAFLRAIGVGPSDYRKRFRSAWPDPSPVRGSAPSQAALRHPPSLAQHRTESLAVNSRVRSPEPTIHP